MDIKERSFRVKAQGEPKMYTTRRAFVWDWELGVLEITGFLLWLTFREAQV